MDFVPCLFVDKSVDFSRLYLENEKAAGNEPVPSSHFTTPFWLAGTDTKIPILIAYSEKEKAVQIIITVEELEAIKEEIPAANLKTVGEDDYGYIKIPSDWMNFLDIAMLQEGIPHIGFMSLDGFIINLGTFGKITMSLEQVAKEVAFGKQKKTKIDGFEAYQFSSYYGIDDSYLYVWYFFDNEGNLRFISAEGPASRITEAVDIVEKTFSLSNNKLQ